MSKYYIEFYVNHRKPESTWHFQHFIAMFPKSSGGDQDFYSPRYGYFHFLHVDTEELLTKESLEELVELEGYYSIKIKTVKRLTSKTDTCKISTPTDLERIKQELTDL